MTGEDDYADAAATEATMDVDYEEIDSYESSEATAVRSDPRGADTSGP